MSPDKKTKNEIDHLLINDISIVNDITVLSHFNFDSDHRISIRNYMRNKGNLKIIIPVSRRWEAIMKLEEQLNPIRSKLTERGINEDQIQETYDEFENVLRETTETYGVKRKEETTGDQITEETLQLIKKKREMWKTMGARKMQKQNIEIQKLVKRKIRDDIKNYDNERIKEIVEDTGTIRKIGK